jgi:pyridoxamine 5'-phosphate oxidase
MGSFKEYLHSDRRDFSLHSLTEADLPNDPFEMFGIWFQQALDAEIPDPYTINVATVTKDNKPSSRILFMRDFNAEGFVFYTNYNSNKGDDIEHNPFATINFYWQQLERQIRISGKIEQVPAAISDAYFSKRPRESQIGAWSSDQSSTLQNREELEDKIAAVTKQFEGKDVPRPPHWGGYIVRPETFEFWQGRKSRLHDRILYSETENGWTTERLSP